MDIQVKIFNPRITLQRIVKNQSVGIFVAETWGRYFSPYVPFRDGYLDQTRQTEPFKVKYVQPYSKRLHDGDGFNFSKEQHQLATSHWENASYAVNKEKVSKEITDFIKRR